MTCSPVDVGVIVSCSDDNAVRVWRLHDQSSLCKDGFRVGSATTLTNHTPTPLSSLNLVERVEEGEMGGGGTTPARQRGVKMSGSTPRTTPNHPATTTPKERGAVPTTPSSSPRLLPAVMMSSESKVKTSSSPSGSHDNTNTSAGEVASSSTTR